MQFSYDRETDAIYLLLSDDPITESEEVRPGVVLDYNERGCVVAIEVVGTRNDGRHEHRGRGTADSVNSADERARLIELGRKAREAYIARLGHEPTEEDWDRELAERRGVYLP